MSQKRKPWDFIQAVNFTKEDLMADPDTDPNDYIPFVTNRSLSYFMDTILYANEMNINSELPRDAQFNYYLKSIRPRKRFSKWEKTVVDDDIKLIQDCFGYNTRRAEEVRKLLSVEQLEALRMLKDPGGAL